MSTKKGFIKDFEKVRKDEIDRIIERRKCATPEKSGEPAKDAVGLALSGGGIRSATFNLGLLQAMERYNFLKRVDYLSTVSGGGYIGSSLTWFMSVLGKGFPFGTKRKHYKKLGGQVLAWLRNHGSYLTPGDGIGVYALISAILTGMVVNLVILIPVFLFILRLLSLNFDSSTSWFSFLSPLFIYAPRQVNTYYFLIFATGLFLFGLFILLTIVFALMTRFRSLRGVFRQRWMRVVTGRIIMFGVIFAVVGTIPLVHGYLAIKLPGWIDWAMSVVSFSGIISILGALRGRKGGNEAKGYRSLFLSLGLGLVVYGIVLWLYHITTQEGYIIDWNILSIALLISGILAVFADINHVSMHRFYRNRLMEAYMPHHLQDAPSTIKKADYCKLKNIPQTGAPYHIICANIQTVGSEDPTLSERGGDSFIFSPLYCGAKSTRYMKTKKYIGGNMNLATAFAISGAAVDPNTYLTRSRPLIFLMALLNIRLGYWIRNPGKSPKTSPLFRPIWTYYMLTEMLGKGLHEKRWNIHLSDGGHFENLGLYELIRRRCRYIIVSDAGADAGWKFGDLGKCIEMVRADFGARVKLNTAAMMPSQQDNISPQAFEVGEVIYDNGDKADIVYIKTAMIKSLPEDVNAYRRTNDTFPDQSTIDQFFDERQFEAYRELGYQIGTRVFTGGADESMDDWIAKLVKWSDNNG